MPRSGAQWLLSVMHRVPQCGHNDSKTVTLDRCPRFCREQLLQKKRLFLFVHVSTLIVFTLRRRSTHWQKTSNRKFYYSVVICICWHGHLQRARAGCEEIFRLRYHAYFTPSQILLDDAIFFLQTSRLFRFSSVLPIKQMMITIMMLLLMLL